MGWTGIKNGKLLSLAEIEFDVFTTIDKNLQFQQSIRKYDLAIIVLDVRSNHITELLPFLPLFIAALPVAPKGEVTPIARPQPTP